MDTTTIGKRQVTFPKTGGNGNGEESDAAKLESGNIDWATSSVRNKRSHVSKEEVVYLRVRRVPKKPDALPRLEMVFSADAVTLFGLEIGESYILGRDRNGQWGRIVVPTPGTEASANAFKLTTYNKASPKFDGWGRMTFALRDDEEMRRFVGNLAEKASLEFKGDEFQWERTTAFGLLFLIPLMD